MSRYEAFPDLEPIDLCDDELDEFLKVKVIPAAEHVWGDKYKDPELAPHVDARTAEILSEYGDGNKVELSFGPELEVQLGDDGEVDETIDPEIYLRVELKVLRTDLTRYFGRKFPSSELEIWESNVYDFYINGVLHEADRYYALKDSEGEELDYDEISPRQRAELKRVSCHPSYSLDRSAEITSQDIIDVHNVLLALDIPEEVMG
jgi:hypothetical protein